MSSAQSSKFSFQSIKRWVSKEASGGILLIIAALAALIWANSPWKELYFDLSAFSFGPEALHLNLSLASWASDGLLALFFFTVGLELKHEMTSGCLSDVRAAVVPILAAVGGMVVPALIFVGVVLLLKDPGALHGWAIPTATDIAFALAVLSVFGRGLPYEMRAFLLTLATVDDLLAIIVIALFYSSGLSWLPLAISFALIAAFAYFANRKTMSTPLLIVLGILAWGFMHASGVHATIAGVLMGVSIPAKKLPGEVCSRTHHFEEFLRPINAAIVLPIFAFFASGATIFGEGGGTDVIFQPVVFAIVLGLILGKLIGIIGTTAILTKVLRLVIPGELRLRKIFPVGFLAGIGFTVSLLISELSFPDSEHTAGAKFAVLTASLLSATIGAFVLTWVRKHFKAERAADAVESYLEPDVLQ